MALAQTIISPPLLLTSDLPPIPSNPPPAAVTSEPDYDRAADVKAFEDTKAGVKGLVDAGLTTIPRFFIHPPENDAVVARVGDPPVHHLPPVIDMGAGRWEEVVEQIREAAGTWGFFQVVNHGVETELMEEMLASTRRFHELPREEKIPFYSRDVTRPVRYVSNGRLLDRAAPADWRDTLAFHVPDGGLDPLSVPPVCREVATEYLKQTLKLKNKLAELLSDAAGLNRDHLSTIKCMESQTMACHYYPPCPQPHLTIGSSKHTDPFCLTILLQDHNQGLQVRNHDRWVDMPKSARGALVVNVGDFLQLITNDKFKSVEHRVVAQSSTTRSSVVCFFGPGSENKYRLYGPAKELVLGGDLVEPVYREVHLVEFLDYFKSNGSPLSHFKLS
ncbi:unnamed protein product [Linum trigynum]|uniref:Fe2OG dioxygenase domain-containing protein n=1 Tax=Linum trigynum TaxID=586398 RepID=A0AAV2EB89_9ROSI